MRESVMAPVVTDPWLTVQQAAAIAQCDPATVRRGIRSGRLRAIRLQGGRHFRMRQSSVDAWLESFAAVG
ncbi:DNA binding domain, excisionase family [Luteitalea pratensis]|uniref:DNA binding domain, excisionase family n=1 Tax=Luteitalea pratensis TaxID=1855912 RepID=A0A143PQQ1_LUTPR|nr:helix-turn-helix domain-containing protein [Luteitalea pratensis]AMY10144.1 DNA binding domain, excisionase family [Luteitalea pratensis]